MHLSTRYTCDAVWKEGPRLSYSLKCIDEGKEIEQLNFCFSWAMT